MAKGKRRGRRDAEHAETDYGKLISIFTENDIDFIVVGGAVLIRVKFV